MRGFSLLAAILLLAGCAATKSPPPPQPAAVELPAWYLHPPRNDATRLYGVGEGATMAEATRRALADLSERVAVTIQSRRHAADRSIDDGAFESVTRERRHTVRSVGALLPLPEYRTLDSRRLAWDRYLVLVSVRRCAVTRILRHRLREGLNEAITQVTAARHDPLSRYRAATDATGTLQALRPEARLLAQLSPEDAALEERVTQSIEALRILAQKTRRALRLRQCAPHDPFARAAARFFESRGIPVARHSDGPALRLRVTTDLRTDRLHGFHIVQGEAVLTLYDGSAPVLSRRYPLKGIASQSDKAARRRAAESLYESLRADPPL